MLQELERVNYSWGRAIELATNCVRWRVLMDALCSPGGDKDDGWRETLCIQQPVILNLVHPYLIATHTIARDSLTVH